MSNRLIERTFPEYARYFADCHMKLFILYAVVELGSRVRDPLIRNKRTQFDTEQAGLTPALSLFFYPV